MIELSDDPARLDRPRVHGWPASGYRSPGLARDLFDRAVAGSHRLGAYAADGAQLGFARAITDGATFAWIADMWVDAPPRGQGLGRRVMGWFLDHLRLAGIRRVRLVTANAHGVYEALGFHPLLQPDRWMERLSPDAEALLRAAP